MPHIADFSSPHNPYQRHWASLFAGAWRKRVITAVVGVCLCIVLIEGNLSPGEIRNRTQTPSIMMLAAIPHRRVKGDTKATAMETVYPGALPQDSAGFTLIEMSIVLVVIGLIVGGVLVGRDLISAAAVRAQISQIEKYQTAVNAFRGKYGYLPGDIKDPDASNFGFKARGTLCGQGDGDGMLLGINNAPNGCASSLQAAGETAMFWVDLSMAHLIDGAFSIAVSNALPGTSTITPTTSPSIGAFLPAARFGNGNYLYVYNGGAWSGGWKTDGYNYFGFSALTNIEVLAGFNTLSNANVPVQQAAAMDKKIDDGLPQTGNVTARYFNGAVVWAAGGGSTGTADTSATSGSSTTCYDNNNVTGAAQQYSITQNNGTGMNCALSFKFQ